MKTNYEETANTQKNPTKVLEGHKTLQMRAFCGNPNNH